MLEQIEQRSFARWPITGLDYMGAPQYGPPIPVRGVVLSAKRRSITQDTATVVVEESFHTPNFIAPGDAILEAAMFDIAGMLRPPSNARTIVTVSTTPAPGGDTLYIGTV